MLQEELRYTPSRLLSWKLLFKCSKLQSVLEAKAVSHSAILCACVDAIKGTDDVLPAKDGAHCMSL